MAMQLAKSFDEKRMRALMAQRALLNKAAAEKLSDAIETAVSEQRATLETGNRLQTVTGNYEAERGKFQRSLLAVLEKARAEKIDPTTAYDVLELALGDEKSLGEGKSASTIKTNRSTIKSFVVVMSEDNFEDIADTAKVDVKKPLTDLTQTNLRDIIKAYQTNPETAEYIGLVRDLSREAKNLIRSRRASEKDGTVALDALPIADALKWLKHTLSTMPKRPVKAVEEQTGNAETLANALDEGEANNGNNDQQDAVAAA